jgi:hypothetical protein
MPKEETQRFADQVREEWTHYLVGLGYEAKAGALFCTSGARCQAHTKALQERGIPAATDSAHNEGLALDLQPKKTLLAEFQKWCRLKLPVWKTVGMESPRFATTWVHLQRREPYRVFTP